MLPALPCIANNRSKASIPALAPQCHQVPGFVLSLVFPYCSRSWGGPWVGLRILSLCDPCPLAREDPVEQNENLGANLSFLLDTFLKAWHPHKLIRIPGELLKNACFLLVPYRLNPNLEGAGQVLGM